MNGSLKRRWRKITLVVLLLVSVCFVVTFVLYRTDVAPTERLPEPNGYDLLRQAAIEIDERLEDYHSLPDEELRAYLDKNREMLNRVREALKLPSAVPVEYTEKWMERQMPVLKGFRDIGHAFEIEAILHSRQGNMDEAVSSALDLVRLGRAISYRGVMIDFMIGSACELQGVASATNMLLQLDAAQCRFAARTLDELNRSREDSEELFRREETWILATWRLAKRAKEVFRRRKLRPERESARTYGDEVQRRILKYRILTVQVAARGFELERGRLPTNSLELVPNFLTVSPVDPTTGQPLPLNKQAP